MARETKAERMLRETAERQLYEESFMRTYQVRLLNLVYDYSNKSPSVFSADRVRTNEFALSSSQDWESEWTFPAVLEAYSAQVDADMEDAERAVQRYEAYRAEEQRRSAVRTEARRKVNELLSDEERELLGL